MTITITFDPLGSINEEDFSQEEDSDDLDELIQSLNEMQDSTDEETTEKKNESITINTLYSSTFDMQATVTTISDMDEQIQRAIDEVGSSSVSPTLGDTEMFESLCMDIIEKIVMINKDWTRQDAIKEAARELVAVRKATQNEMAEVVHMRVLYEFQIATDYEYLLLRKQIWGE